MKFSYNKLWKLLIDKGWTKTKLKQKTGISTSTIAKLGKEENVTTDVLLKNLYSTRLSDWGYYGNYTVY